MKQKMNIGRKAGLLYLLLIPLGVLGILFIPSYFFVADDINATMENIANDEGLFRMGIVSSLATQIVQIFVVLALYRLFKEVNQRMAAFMVISILVAVPIAMLNELNYFAVLESLGNGEQVSLFLSLHEYGVFIAQIFWGIWLFPMGYLAYKSGFIPKIIGVLLIIACFGYLIDSMMVFLKLDLGFVFSDFTFLGEFAIVLWLIIKGKKEQNASN
ncbi:MAG: DUF4386 domain-containing protein [Flavobacteriales bacterium]|nr:DUF4386 domain-containing protein [Flavobacteriales bacterium]